MPVISAKITINEKKQILECITYGKYKSVSDFIRQVVKKELEKQDFSIAVVQKMSLLPIKWQQWVENQSERYTEKRPLYSTVIDYLEMDAVIMEAAEKAGIIWEEPQNVV